MPQADHLDAIALYVAFDARMDSVIKDIIPGKTPMWPNRRAARAYVGERYEFEIHEFSENYLVSTTRIRGIVGGVKTWQDSAANLF